MASQSGFINNHNATTPLPKEKPPNNRYFTETAFVRFCCI